jgi:hypothetical protein
MGCDIAIATPAERALPNERVRALVPFSCLAKGVAAGAKPRHGGLR